MKRSLFLKTFCCLLALCLLSGCTSKSPLLAHADNDSGLKKEYVDIDLVHQWGYSVENREGKALSLIPDTVEYEDYIGAGNSYTLEGTMEYISERSGGIAKSGEWRTFQVPFSKTFTVYNNVVEASLEKGIITEAALKEKKYLAESRVTFFAEDSTMDQLTGGDWSKVVHHCNNVIELYGDLSEFIVCFNCTKGIQNGRLDIGREESYALKGSGRDHVIIALADGEILTEGMTGNYTVTRRTKDSPVDTQMEYDETGKLLHMEGGYFSRVFSEFRPFL